ncbi:MAG: DUF1080 domain-containing protein [Ferruginibacter sp.]|nr:DUF1080 domain-containing protein [Cytophagales bacterium]
MRNFFPGKHRIKFTFLAVSLATVGCSEQRAPDQAALLADSTPVVPAAAPVDSAAINTLTEAETREGWRLLFDGKSTAAFRGYNQPAFPTQGWKAQDGLLVVEAAPGGPKDRLGGDIVTKEQFDNFEFKLDFKLSPGANSGILYLVKETKDPSWHSAPEFQLIDNEVWAKQLDMNKRRTGDAYDMQASVRDAMKPIGEWNEAMIRVKDGQVEHWLNGQKVVAYTLGSPEWKTKVKGSKFAAYPEYGASKKGYLGIQEHGHQLWFRNLKVREI